MGEKTPIMGEKTPMMGNRFFCCLKTLQFCPVNNRKNNAMAFRKKFIVGDESLNTYGTWLLNAGADMSYIEKYSPAYYDHKDWEVPVGHWENIKLNADGKWEAELVIEGADDREKMYIRKLENGDIKGASFGLDVVETSDEPVYLKQGQTRRTVIKWQPYEISITPSPGNANASVVLRNQNQSIRLNSSNTESDILEKVLPNIKNSKQLIKMEKIALALGLSVDSSEVTILDALKIVLSKSTQTETLSKYVEDLAKETLSDEQHKFFVELNKTNSTQALEFLKLNRVVGEPIAIKTATTATKVSDVLAAAKVQLNKGTAVATEDDDKETYEYLSKNNPNKLLQLKRSEPEKFKAMEAAYVASRKGK